MFGSIGLFSSKNIFVVNLIYMKLFLLTLTLDLPQIIAIFVIHCSLKASSNFLVCLRSISVIGNDNRTKIPPWFSRRTRVNSSV
jgi:hypothetical protein